MQRENKMAAAQQLKQSFLLICKIFVPIDLTLYANFHQIENVDKGIF
jgi:hypothetical protein